jgi:ABC-type branched-subunit amino acid transport system substrate-binding protein
VVVVAARTPEAIAITRSLHGLLPGAAVLVGDAVPLNPAFIRAVGSAALSLYGVSWWSPSLPDSLSRAFVAGWERANRSSPSASDAMYYDAIMLAAQAVREAGPSRAAVRRYLGELGTSRPPYQGVTGPISFAPNRATNLLATRIDHGVATLVNRR